MKGAVYASFIIKKGCEYSMADYILEMNHITKEFPGVKALDDVTFDIRRGEIHALCGENGAGDRVIIRPS